MPTLAGSSPRTSQALLGAGVRYRVRVSVVRPVGPVGANQSDLARVRVLRDIGAHVGGHDQHTRNVSPIVSNLVAAGRTTRKRHDIAFLQLSVAVVQAHRRLATNDDE